MNRHESSSSLCGPIQHATTSNYTQHVSSPNDKALVQSFNHESAQSSGLSPVNYGTKQRRGSSEGVLNEHLLKPTNAHESSQQSNLQLAEYTRTLENFARGVVGNGDDFVRVRGRLNALDGLEVAIRNGFMAVQTSNIERLGLLNALDQCLSGLHHGDGRYAASVQEMQQAIRSNEYAWIVFRLHPNLDHATMFSTYFIEQDHTLDQADVLLYLLGQYTGEVYQLGVVSIQHALGSIDPEHQVTLRPTLYGHSPTATIFIYNKIYRAGICSEDMDHWFGLTPYLSGSSNMVQAPKQEDQDEARINGDQARQQVECATASTGRGKVVPCAPPYNSLLPFEYMQGITSRELLDFFPNHCFHWPAISARLILDGWTFKDIRKRVQEVRGFEITANSILNSMTKGCKKISGDPAWNISRYKSGKGALPITELQAMPWVPIDYNKNKEYSIDPSWTLKEIGLSFKFREKDIPGQGKFRDRVVAAVIDGTDANKPSKTDDPTPFNPPELPPNRLLGIPSNANSSQPEASIKTQEPHERRLYEDLSFFIRPLKHGELADADLRDKILAKTDSDPQEVIGRYSKFLTGEVLLWLLSRGTRKGNLESTTISESLQRHFGDPSNPRKEVCHRTTISKRKGQALKARAIANNTTYDFEFKQFEDKEAFHARCGARALRNDAHPIRRRENRKKTDPYNVPQRSSKLRNGEIKQNAKSEFEMNQWSNMKEACVVPTAVMQHRQADNLSHRTSLQVSRVADMNVIDPELFEVAQWVRNN